MSFSLSPPSFSCLCWSAQSPRRGETLSHARMASGRARSFSKQASEHATGGAAAAAASAAASALPLLAPLSALESWLDEVSPSCGLPSSVGPREEGDDHAVGAINGGDELVRALDAAVSDVAALTARMSTRRSTVSCRSRRWRRFCVRTLPQGLTACALSTSVRRLTKPEFLNCALTRAQHGTRERHGQELAAGGAVPLRVRVHRAYLEHALEHRLALAHREPAQGLEVVRSRHDCAEALAARFQASLLATARPAGGVTLSLCCVSFLEDISWADRAHFVLCNCLMFPDALLTALIPSLLSLRAGALVATVVVPLPCPAFRLLRVRHVACSWGTADLLLHRRMEHGAAWQRARTLIDGSVAHALLSCEELIAAGVLQRLRLLRASTGDADAASLLVVGAGDSALPAQLAAACRDTAVHACDLDPDAIAAQRALHEGVAFAVADVCDLPLEDAAWCRDADALSSSPGSSPPESPGSWAEGENVPPRLFDALLDQCTLDVLPALHPGGRALLHAALCSLCACLKPGHGVACLLSLRPPAEAMPLLRAHPAMRWRVEAELLDAQPRAVWAYFCSKEDDADDDRSAAPGRCSFAVRGKVAVEQPWWECATCVQEAVCEACAAGPCHAGHALAPAMPPEGLLGLERGFCDCGFSGRCACSGVPPLRADEQPLAPVS